MKEYAKSFYFSVAWRKCRETYLKSVGNLCETCLEHGLYTPAKVVHHKQHITQDNINNPFITLNQDNLKAVCQNCHAKEHEKERKKGKTDRYFVSSDGKILAPPFSKK